MSLRNINFRHAAVHVQEGMLELRTKLSSLEQTKLTVPTISSQPVSTAAQSKSLVYFCK